MPDDGRDGGGKMGCVFGLQSDNTSTATRRHRHKDITATTTAKQQGTMGTRNQRGNNGDMTVAENGARVRT